MENIVIFGLDTHHFIYYANKKEDSFDGMSFHPKQTLRMDYFITTSIIRQERVRGMLHCESLQHSLAYCEENSVTLRSTPQKNG